MFGHFITLCMKGLTHLMTLVSFYTSENISNPLVKPSDFLIFSRGAEREHWYEMGQLMTNWKMNPDIIYILIAV